ncbi:hypothetical protein SRIMM317S_02434 [Streptomyces rimosus subsp. rimosus]
MTGQTGKLLAATAVTSAAGAMGATAMTGEAAAAYGGTGAGRSATGGGEATGTDTSGTDAAGTGAAEASAQGARPRVRAGFDRLAADGYALLSGRRIGIVTNPTGVTPDVRHIVDVMHADKRVDLAAVFGPEHGFRGTAQAGGSEGSYEDPATGLPVPRHVRQERPGAGGHLHPVRRGHRRLRHPGRRRALLHLHLDAVRLHGRVRPSRANTSSSWTAPTR